MTTDRMGKIAYGVAILVALLGAFFLGFSACGAEAGISLAVVIIALASMCFAVVMRWRLVRGSLPAQSSRLRSALSLASFIVVLLTGCVVANTLGWVVYYSPTSVEAAYREFKAGLIGDRCG